MICRFLCCFKFRAFVVQPFRSFFFGNRLFDLLQIIICLPLTGEFLTDTFIIYIDFIPNIIPDSITVFRFNHTEPFIGFFFGSNSFYITHDLLDKWTFFHAALFQCFTNGSPIYLFPFFSYRRCALFCILLFLLVLFQSVLIKITLLLNQRINAIGNLCPGQLHLITAAFGVSNSFGIVIFTTARSTGKGMRVTTCPILIFQEIRLFFCRMFFLPIFIDTDFSTGETTASGQGFIDFIIRNKLTDKRWHGHTALIFSEWQIKLIQPLCQAFQFVIMESQQRRILIVCL